MEREPAVILGELVERAADGHWAIVMAKLTAIGRAVAGRYPTSMPRQKPNDPALILVPELERYGLSTRNVNALVEWLCDQAEAADRPADMECLSVGYLCQFPAEAIDMPNFGAVCLNELRRALAAAGRDCDPPRKVALLNDICPSN